jgi:hypothetical protein
LAPLPAVLEEDEPSFEDDVEEEPDELSFDDDDDEPLDDEPLDDVVSDEAEALRLSVR